jgi:hypothetical protein
MTGITLQGNGKNFHIIIESNQAKDDKKSNGNVSSAMTHKYPRKYAINRRVEC